jgi:hypothetical protein
MENINMTIEEIKAIDLDTANASQVDSIIKSLRNLDSDEVITGYIDYLNSNTKESSLGNTVYKMLLSGIKDLLIFSSMRASGV